MCVLPTYSAIKWVKMMCSNADECQRYHCQLSTLANKKKQKRGEFTTPPCPTGRQSNYCLLLFDEVWSCAI